MYARNLDGGGAKSSFEQAWATLARATRDMLLRKGVSPWIVDDVVQETGIRLFRVWGQVDPGRDPRPFVFAIARNVLCDELNRSGREVPGTIPDTAADHDVERSGIARLELFRIRRALKHLNPAHQAAILAELGDSPEPEGSAAAVKMVRMRARRKLNKLLDTGSVGGFIGLAKRWNEKLNAVIRRGGVAFESTGSAIAAVAGSVAVFVAVTVAPSPASVLPARHIAPPAAERPGSTEGSVLSVTGRSGTSASEATKGPSSSAETTGKEVAEDDGEILAFTHGDGPVRGGAHAHSHEGDGRLDPPSCSTDTNYKDEVSASCTVDAGEKEYELGANLSVHP